jgi:hypothetical protein
MRKPTIYQIKAGYEALAQAEGDEAHFFDCGTLRFFNEHLYSLKVIKTDDPRMWIVKTRNNLHYFSVDGDGKSYPYCYYRHWGTTRPDGQQSPDVTEF